VRNGVDTSLKDGLRQAFTKAAAKEAKVEKAVATRAKKAVKAKAVKKAARERCSICGVKLSDHPRATEERGNQTFRRSRRREDRCVAHGAPGMPGVPPLPRKKPEP
jgi:hypothetical protein